MPTVRDAADLVAQLSGLAILAGTLAAVAAVVYRWYVREEVPRGLALLVGLSGVAVYLNTTTALGQVIGGSTVPTGTAVALFNIAAFLAGAGGALAGRQAGDWFGTEVLLGRGGVEVERDVGRLVQSVGRVTAVELPEDIGDVVGYDPVPEETKAKLAGKTFLFPRRLTVDDLRERLVSRLKSDYGVGHVDVELAADGTVEYLALGSRAAGIGPTLPPATNAVAIRADPAFAASAGDLVQVWETDPMRRVLTAELRGVADDTVTIAIDAADTQKIDPTKQYRLVTLPVEDRPDREFASLLRAAEETFSSVTVEAGSPLHGMPVGALDLAVVAVEPDGERSTTLPAPTTVLAPGDAVYAIARPDALRRLEAAARPLDPSLASTPADRTRSPSAAQPTPDDSAAGTEVTAESEATDASTPDEAAVSDAASPGPDQQADVPTNGDAAADATADEGATPGETTAEGATADDVGETTDDEGTDTAGADGDDDAATGDFDPPAASGTDDPETAGKADESSFQQLKEEFESGGADWAEDAATDDSAAATDAATDDSAAATDAATDDSAAADAEDAAADDRTEPANGEPIEESDADEVAFGDADDALDAAGDDLSFDDADDDDGLDGLDIDDDADDSPDEDDEGLSFDDGDDGGLDGLNLDDEDDLSFDESEDDGGLDGLSFEDDEDEGLSLEDGDDDGLSFDEDETDGDSEEDEIDASGEGETDADEADDEDDEAEDDEEDEDEDDGGGGGASSFQQLKEEFESGEADWEDDVSDSPGGDMRLDE